MDDLFSTVDEEFIPKKEYTPNKEYKGGFNKFPKKEDVAEEPYRPVVIYIDRKFPEEILTKLQNVASTLLAKNMTVRYNGDHPPFHQALSTMDNKYTEVYIPWKGFNDIESKHYFNGETSKYVAGLNNSNISSLPSVIQSMLARNVRMLFGDKNNSPCMCLITWSQDAANTFIKVNKETGPAGSIIKMASNYGFPVINIANPNYQEILGKVYQLN